MLHQSLRSSINATFYNIVDVAPGGKMLHGWNKILLSVAQAHVSLTMLRALSPMQKVLE